MYIIDKVYVPDKDTEQVLRNSKINCGNSDVYQDLVLKQSQRNDLGDPNLEIVSSILKGNTVKFVGKTGYEVYDRFEDISRILDGYNTGGYTEADNSYGVIINSYDINPLEERSIIVQGRYLKDAGNDLYNFFIIGKVIILILMLL